MYRTVWDSKEPFGRQKPFAAKKQKTNVSFCPKTFTMWLKTPKANSVGEKCEKELKEMGDKSKEVMGEPSAEPFRKRKGSAPEDQRHHETCATFVKPWWNLDGTLVEPSAEPFGSPRRICPENHRESKSNSAPKPLLG